MATIELSFTIDIDDEYGYAEVVPDSDVPEDELTAQKVVELLKKDYDADKHEMIKDFDMLDFSAVQIHVSVHHEDPQQTTRAVW